MNSLYEPIPQWDCEHSWYNAGAPYKITVDSGTDLGYTYPDAPLTQKQVCVNCGGVQYISLPPSHYRGV